MMARFVLIRDICEYLTYRIRTTFLISLVFLSVVPGAFLFHLPVYMRVGFVYVYVVFLYAAGFSMYGAYRGQVQSLLGFMFLGRKYREREYSTPGLRRLLR